ncbi:hypothetical protein NP493_196g03008 [Ridgeia piscesae]|uniref:Ectonucleotide pyrophosphatase/phosphodiesterase family member 6 n=1 Tax=Ridgeia piscesae TaxID=27915 RepID=A0AAD9UEP4_RIDPI|nr:hypothetical protein NP493_196g03008 [Ridgeia piscesae]
MSPASLVKGERVGRSRRRSCMGRQMLVLLFIICVIIALGLGFGLGLRQSSQRSPEPHKQQPGCFSSLQHNKSDRRVDKHWIDSPCLDAGQAPVCPEGVSVPPLLLISLDGFRADYLVRNFTPVLRRMSECGVHAPYMRSVFPSKTFPNHYTQVTGLYPESHGIIDNRMYDTDVKEMFTLKSETMFDPRWWQGEPDIVCFQIWNTVHKANKRSAIMFWPGSDVKIQG